MGSSYYYYYYYYYHYYYCYYYYYYYIQRKWCTKIYNPPNEIITRKLVILL